MQLLVWRASPVDHGFRRRNAGRITGDPWDNFDHIPRVGRAISAAIDTITVLLIFLVAGRLFNRKAGLLAAAIYAGTPMAIQLSHFYTTDIWLACFVTLTLWLACLLSTGNGMAGLPWPGPGFGFAMASKGSVLLLAGVVALAAIVVAYRSFDERDPGRALIAGFTRLAPVVSPPCCLRGVRALRADADEYLRRSAPRTATDVERRDRLPLYPAVHRHHARPLPTGTVDEMGHGTSRGPAGFVGVALMIWWAIRRQPPI